MNIGEASAVVTILHFINPQSEDRPSPEETQTALALLRDKAAKALQVSGPHIVSDAELQDMIMWLEEWANPEDYDGPDLYGTGIPVIEDIDTHGRT